MSFLRANLPIASKDQYVLLCVEQYVASKSIPFFDWNEIAKLIAPTVTGEAIKQHLAKLRKAREEAGQPIPPSIGKDHGSGLRKNNLIASTQTPRLSQASAEEFDPFANDQIQGTKRDSLDIQKNEATDPKLASLIFQKKKPVKTRTPVSKKRKTATDDSTPTYNPRNKKNKTIGSNFANGHETDHVLALYNDKMGYAIKRDALLSPEARDAIDRRRRMLKIRDAVAMGEDVNVNINNASANLAAQLYYGKAGDGANENFNGISAANTVGQTNKPRLQTMPQYNDADTGDDANLCANDFNTNKFGQINDLKLQNKPQAHFAEAATGDLSNVIPFNGPPSPAGMIHDCADDFSFCSIHANAHGFQFNPGNPASYGQPAPAMKSPKAPSAYVDDISNLPEDRNGSADLEGIDSDLFTQEFGMPGEQVGSFGGFDFDY